MTVRGHVPSKWWHWDLSPALATIYKTAGLGKGPEMSSREGGPQGRGWGVGTSHLWQERQVGAVVCRPQQPSAWVRKGRRCRAAARYSLAFGLCVCFGSCIESTQLSPVIGRDCRVSTGRKRYAWGAAGSNVALLPVHWNQTLGGRDTMDSHLGYSILDSQGFLSCFYIFIASLWPPG